MKTNYSNARIYQALKRNFLMDLRYVSLDLVNNQQPQLRNRRMFIINAQRDVLYYPDIHFFTRPRTKALKKHNYANTIRTLEDIKILSEAFNDTDKEPKDLNHWFSAIYNLRTPFSEGGEPVKETLTNIKTEVSNSL